MGLFSLGQLLFLTGFLKFTETYFNYEATTIYAKKIIPITIFACVVAYLCTVFTVMQTFFDSIFGLFVVSFSLLFPFWLAIRAKQQPAQLKIIWFVAMAPIAWLNISYSVYVLLEPFGIEFDYGHPRHLRHFPATAIFLLTVFSLSIGYRKNLLKKEKEIALEQNLKDQKIIIEKLAQATKLEKIDEVKTQFLPTSPMSSVRP